MTTIAEMQAEHSRWLSHNFPHQRNHEPLLGLMEEVGELAHAHLKSAQGIREIDAELDKVDAIGDIFIYLMSYCNSNGVDLEKAIAVTWDRVRTRDWQADPKKGGE
jgi:NTP pyrophosphatase (non-canonical NTP hydrolase)